MLRPTKGIVVDGACSNNPGSGEYRGLDLETGEVLFHHKFQLATNNVMEFCAAVHALRLMKQNPGKWSVVWTDSKTAMSWVDRKAVNTDLKKNEKTQVLWQFINNCERYLLENFKNSVPLSKWDTKSWGEIPADFGYKKPVKEEKEKPFLPSGIVKKKDLLEWVERELQSPLLSQTGKDSLTELIKYFQLK